MADSTATEAPRLTALSHGGGCGCKISPAVLSELLQGHVSTRAYADLLVGAETGDDAAVFRLNDEQAVVATTDFFMPIVDDPFDFGRIAATNALSDIYAMGGTPIMALAIVGMPVNVLAHETIRRILKGGESVCTQAGIPVAGGHSIDSVEPIYGLVAIGIVRPADVRRNSTARAGDALILTKPIGVGVLSAALKKNAIDSAGYQAMIASTTQLNDVGPRLAARDDVHAITDVTGFGLLGHLLEMCRGSGLAAELHASDVPLIGEAPALVEAGFVTGASARNWASYGHEVAADPPLAASARILLTDPQTSGGLLIACDENAAGAIIALCRSAGFDRAARIGRMVRGAPQVVVSGS